MMPDPNFSPPQGEDDEVPEDHGQEANSWLGRTCANSTCQTKFWECYCKPNTVILDREMAVDSSDSNSHCIFAVFNGFFHRDFDENPFFVVL
jgi:hypothetical protein